VAALRHDRIDAPWLLDGPINGDSFQTYIAKVLVPTLKPGDIVALDNLSSHKRKAVRHAIGLAGARLFYLPQYSPDLNPIEHVFANSPPAFPTSCACWNLKPASLKHGLRKQAARSLESVCACVGELLETFTPKECANYFKHAGYG